MGMAGGIRAKMTIKSQNGARNYASPRLPLRRTENGVGTRALSNHSVSGIPLGSRNAAFEGVELNGNGSSLVARSGHGRLVRVDPLSSNGTTVLQEYKTNLSPGGIIRDATQINVQVPPPEIRGKLRVFSGTANDSLAKEIACYLGIELGEAKIKHFADGETYIRVDESIRGADVFIVQPTSPPVNDHLMELLLFIDACKRASARSITAVLPYFGY